MGKTALGDVARNVRRTDDPSVQALDRRDGHRHIDEASVLGATNRFKVIDFVATSKTRKHVGFLIQSIRREDQRDVPADRLLGRITEYPLGADVPEFDRAIKRLAEDRIVR